MAIDWTELERIDREYEIVADREYEGGQVLSGWTARTRQLGDFEARADTLTAALKMLAFGVLDYEAREGEGAP